jgi:hypothetical protein
MEPERLKNFDLEELVRAIGYQLTAYIAGSTVQTVGEWLQNALPGKIEERMQAALDIAGPIAKVESELVAQGFLITKREELGSYETPATMLRDAEVSTARTALMALAQGEFLRNEASDLEGIENRLKTWIKYSQMPPNTAYSVRLWKDRLSLTLIHAGFSEDKQLRWDNGLDWPLWAELIAVEPEMAAARVNQNLQTGNPFRYLRRAGSKSAPAATIAPRKGSG